MAVVEVVAAMVVPRRATRNNTLVLLNNLAGSLNIFGVPAFCVYLCTIIMILKTISDEKDDVFDGADGVCSHDKRLFF